MFSRGPDRRTRTWVVLAFLFLFRTIAAQAQVFDFEKDRVPMAELDGPMRFRAGDDPRWADPNFDDSSWSLLRPNSPWGAQGYPYYGGLAWYRFRVFPPRDHPQFAILFYRVSGSYQVFADGQLVGQMGQLPPRPQPFFDSGKVYALPPETDPSRPIEIAVRVWCWQQWAGGCRLGSIPPRIGESDRLEYWLRAVQSQSLWDNSASNCEAAIQLMAGLAGLALFLLRTKEREYFWFGFFEIFSAVNIILRSSHAAHTDPVKTYLASIDVANLAASLCFLAFLSLICGLRRARLFWIAVTSWAAVDLALLLSTVKEWMYLYQWWQTVPIMEVPYALFAFFLVFRGMGWGNPDARLVLVPVGLDSAVRLLNKTSAIPWSWVPHVLWIQQLFGRLRSDMSVFSRPFPVTVPELTVALIQFSIIAILILRFARSRRDEERFKGEFEAARVVQQVLVPEEVPSVSGFRVECVYKPAGEVAGDFFQVFPLPNDGLLAVVGDVSGKGMPAAMTVSLLVGTVRTLAHFWQSPGQILAAMNQRMLARSKDGFTTCVVVRVDADGRVTVANAGHLAPYIDGREVALTNGLPLGLVAGSEYEETEFTLAPGEQLTVLTDGVVEAQSKTRELFGFERAAGLAQEGAERIAEAAVSFGQQDDVTVVTIKRVVTTINERRGVVGLSPIEA